LYPAVHGGIDWSQGYQFLDKELQPQETRNAAEERYRGKLALAKSLYRRGYSRNDILELFRFIDWMMQLPGELDERLWTEIQQHEKVKQIP